MSKAEKKNVDIEKLSTFMRNGFIIIGLVIIAGYFLFKLIGLELIANFVAPVSFVLGIAIIIVSIQKYDHNKKQQSKFKNRKSKM